MTYEYVSCIFFKLSQWIIIAFEIARFYVTTNALCIQYYSEELAKCYTFIEIYGMQIDFCEENVLYN